MLRFDVDGYNAEFDVFRSFYYANLSRKKLLDLDFFRLMESEYGCIRLDYSYIIRVVVIFDSKYYQVVRLLSSVRLVD